jgi:UDP-glucose 4-epimerase
MTDNMTLVTGGTGVFGSYVVRQLVARGERPVVVSRRGDPTLISDVIDDVALELTDLGDVESCETLLSIHGVTRVAHLAALMPDTCEMSPGAAVTVNVGGVANLLEAARRTGVRRVVYASAKGVYAPIGGVHGHPEYRPIAEDMRLLPQSVYCATKYAGEVIGANYERRFGIEVLSLRFSMSYGPGKQARHGDLAIHSRIVENAMRGIETVIEYGGDQADDMIYVGDVAAGILAALDAPTPESRVFNIGTGIGATLQDFADAVRTVLPGAKLSVGPGLKYLGKDRPPRYSVFDISRARHELGYAPTFDLETGVADYVRTVLRLDLLSNHARLAS